MPDRLGSVEPLGEPAVQRGVEFTEAVRPPQASHGNGHDMPKMTGRPWVDFLINGRTFAMDEVMFEGQVGEIEEWEVFNNSHMDHPFHVHGTYS